MSLMRRLYWVAARVLWTSIVATIPIAEAEVPLTPHVAEYNIKISLLGGKLNTTLDLVANGYRAESTIKATGLSRIIARGNIVESSFFRIPLGGLRPNWFISDDSLTRKKKNVEVIFNWQTNTVQGISGGMEFETALFANTHDRLSLQYVLMHDLLNDDLRDNYLLQDAEELKTLTITTNGTREIEVPFGHFKAVGIQHQTPGSNRTTTLWMVKELGFIPAVIEQRRKGKVMVRAELSSYALLGQ